MVKAPGLDRWWLMLIESYASDERASLSEDATPPRLRRRPVLVPPVSVRRRGAYENRRSAVSQIAAAPTQLGDT